MALKWLTQDVIERELKAAQVTEITDSDTAVLTQAMEDAEGELLSYIGRRYPAECAAGTASDYVRKLAADLALYELGKRRVGLAQVFMLRAKEARAALVMIRDGQQDVFEWEAAATTEEPLEMAYPELPARPMDLAEEWRRGHMDEVGTNLDVEPGEAV